MLFRSLKSRKRTTLVDCVISLRKGRRERTAYCIFERISDVRCVSRIPVYTLQSLFASLYTPIMKESTSERKCKKIVHSVQAFYTFFLPCLPKAANWPIKSGCYIKDLRLETNFGQVEWMFKTFDTMPASYYVENALKKCKLLVKKGRTLP